MKTKLLYFLLPFGFSGCLASMPSSNNANLLELNKQLIEAAEKGSLDLVDKLLENGADVNTRDDFNYTALHKAARHGHVNCLKALISAKADVDAQDKAGYTALHRTEHVDCVKALIEAKANVNSKTNIGDTVLHHFAKNGLGECVKMLNDSKIDVNALNNNGDTALHWASTKRIAKTLIDLKADVNAIDRHGKTALHWAAVYGDHESAKALVAANANVNALNNDGATAVHKAAEYGHHLCIKVLVEANASVNVCDKEGKTAVHRAAENGKSGSLQALIEAKADVSVRDKKGETALALAARNGTSSDCVKGLARSSYVLVPSDEVVSQSRKRIFNVLLQFVRLRKQHPELENLKAESLQFEILSWNKLLQEDLVIILLDELKKGKEIKSAALIRSKGVAVTFLLKTVGAIISSYHRSTSFRDMRELCDPTKLEKNFGALVLEGLNERCEQLKAKNI